MARNVLKLHLAKTVEQQRITVKTVCIVRVDNTPLIRAGVGASTRAVPVSDSELLPKREGGLRECIY